MDFLSNPIVSWGDISLHRFEKKVIPATSGCAELGGDSDLTGELSLIPKWPSANEYCYGKL
jgi:hypothetical protein